MVQSRSRSRTPPRSYRTHSSTRSRNHAERRSSRRRRHHHSRSSSASGRSSYSYDSSTTPKRSRPVSPPPSSCVGVFGLSYYTREEDLQKVFGKYGTIEKAMIVYDAKTKSSRGFGFVYFQELEAACAAKMQCNGMVLHERTIRVDYSVTDRPHTPTPGVYMGERDGRTKSRSSYGYRGRSYDDDYHHHHRRRSRRSCSCSSRHRRHRRTHRHHRRSSYRSRSTSGSSFDSRH